MARSSGSSGGSYREWAAAERAAQKLREQQERQVQKERIAAEVRARDKEAAVKTRAIEQRVAELESLLRSSLAMDPRVNIDLLKITATVPPLELGTLADPVPVPEWADFARRPPSPLGRLFGGSQRYQASNDAAERAFASAKADHDAREAARLRQLAAARADWSRAAADTQCRAAARNAHIDWLSEGFRKHDRFAVSEYVQMALPLTFRDFESLRLIHAIL